MQEKRENCWGEGGIVYWLDELFEEQVLQTRNVIIVLSVSLTVHFWFIIWVGIFKM